MSALDKVKEQLGYLKFWLGVIIATLISVCGWLINNIQTDKYFFITLAFITIILMVAIIYYLNKLINKMIDNLENL